MVTVTCLAVLLGAAVGLPAPTVAILARLCSQAVFITVLLGVIHGRGRLRTFCIGGLVACVYYLAPELLSPRGGSEQVLADLAESLLAERTGTFLAAGARAILGSLAGLIELVLSVVTLGFFSIWIRKRLDR